jgi:hypothetical protein
VTGFVLGVLISSSMGLVFLLATDKEVRESFVTVLWSIVVAPFFAVVVGFVALGRLLPGGRWPLVKPPKPLSPEALRRVAYRLGADGWVITWRNGGILLIRKGKGNTE